VKLLFDENLSRKLVSRLAELYAGSAHVGDFNLLQQSDRKIWEVAQREKFIIVSTDADFYELATVLGPPPKVIWLRRWRHPTQDAEWVLRREAVRITEFAADPNLSILVLDRD
jgi:predicted nuclease of predicted toxin-antitoxin system